MRKDDRFTLVGPDGQSAALDPVRQQTAVQEPASTTPGQIRYGSKGDDVKTLQEMLNKYGYNLAVDGSFGSKTLEAVRDYQQKNNLAVDGVVGKNTWGALYGTNSGNTSTGTGSGGSTNASQSSGSGGFSYSEYAPSETVLAAEAALQQFMSQKPGAYESQWQQKVNEMIDAITGREKFSYDLNADALYQQLAQQYQMQGKMAMMDTMGQAAALTGGYGSSYGQNVGQQAYQSHLQQLGELTPELYQMALDRYNQEGQDMLNQLGIMMDQENQDYSRHQDKLSEYYAELDRLQENARYLSEEEYNRYMDNLNMKFGIWADNRDFQYQKDRDAVADQKWQAEFDQAQNVYDAQLAGYTGEAVEGGYQRAEYARTDANGNTVFYINGKEYTYAPGINPYTNTKNKDVAYGTFTNGYQPDNVAGKELYEVGLTDVINGVTQPVYMTYDGTMWIWNDLTNEYDRYELSQEEKDQLGISAGIGDQIINKVKQYGNIAGGTLEDLWKKFTGNP